MLSQGLDKSASNERAGVGGVTADAPALYSFDNFLIEPNILPGIELVTDFFEAADEFKTKFVMKLNTCLVAASNSSHDDVKVSSFSYMQNLCH
jgi:hypothetical protein